VRPRQRNAFRAAMRRCHDLPFTQIGRLTDEPGSAWLERGGRLEPLPAGYTHF